MAIADKLGLTLNDSPGFIGREWIETFSFWLAATVFFILPALLVGSGLKQ